MKPARVRPIGHWLEPLLAIVILAGLARAMIHVWTHGYLPQPYFHEAGEVWMDWFSTAGWARDPGTYDSWGSVYPPLTFVLLKLMGLPFCYMQGGGGEGGYAARGCDWLGAVAIHAIFVLNVVLIARTFVRIDRRTAWPRAVALSAGLPMTAALERGNLILLAFTGLILAYGPLLRSARWRWVAVACAINLKPYLIATLFPQLLRRRWRWFEGAVFTVVIVYLVSFAMLGRGTPWEIVTNITGFAEGQADALPNLWYAYTYASTMTLLQAGDLPVASLIGAANVDALLVVLPALTLIAQGLIVAAAAAAWLRPEAVPMFRLTALGLCFALVTSETGGYAAMLPILFVFMEPWRGSARKCAIVACYLICVPLDWPLYSMPPLVRETFFGGRVQPVDYAIMLGPFVRPMLNMSIPVALACLTLREVWDDIRGQRWRSRRRFRHDLHILTGEGQAVRPA